MAVAANFYFAPVRQQRQLRQLQHFSPTETHGLTTTSAARWQLGSQETSRANTLATKPNADKNRIVIK